MKNRLVVSLLFLSLCTASIHARFYAGMGFGSLDYDQANISTYSHGDTRLILGYSFLPLMTIEAHLGVASEDSQLISGTPVSLEIDNYLALLIKADYNLATNTAAGHINFNFYIGMTSLETSTSDPVSVRSGDQSSVSYGAGFEFITDSDLVVRLTYMNYIDESNNGVDFTLGGWNFGLVYLFE